MVISFMDFRVRRARRADLGDIAALLEAVRLPAPTQDRAVLRRFRNIVADLGGDFDVASARDRVRGFVHLAYARDLHQGNRAQMLALVSDSLEVRDALIAASIERASRRHCQDLTVLPGPWTTTVESEQAIAGWHRLDGCLRIDLAGERGAESSASPVEHR